MQQDPTPGDVDVDFPSERLWNFHRLKANLLPAACVFLLLWTPVGVVICALRVAFLILAASLYPLAHYTGLGGVYSQCVLPLLSFWVTVRGRENLRESGSQIVVSNHVSDFDACAAWAVKPPGAWTLVMNDHWKTVVRCVKAVGWPINTIWTSEGKAKEEVRAALQADTARQHVLFFPEGATCSGIAVMQFNWFIFGLERSVVPFAIRLRNPWPVQMQMNGVSVLHNILALFFVPMVFYEITILPEVSCRGLSKEEFAGKVRTQIRTHLGVPGTLRGLEDKKRYSQERKQRLKA